MGTQINFVGFNIFICSKSIMSLLLDYVNMLQVLDVKLDIKLKLPDSSITCITLECYSFCNYHVIVVKAKCHISCKVNSSCQLSLTCIKLCANCENKTFFSQHWIFHFLSTLSAFPKFFVIFIILLLLYFCCCFFVLFFFSFFEQRRGCEQNRVRYFPNDKSLLSYRIMIKKEVQVQKLT